MQPADRQQMGQPRVAHGLLVAFGNGAAIAAGQRRGNRPRRAVEPAAHMRGEPPLDRGDGQARLRRRGDQLDFSHDRSRCRQPVEPGTPREIIRSGDDWRGRRHQPRRQPHPRALAQAGPVLRQRQVHAIGDRPPGLRIARGEDKPDAVLRRLLLALEDTPVDPLEPRIRNRLRPHHRRARPYQRHAERQGDQDRQACGQQVGTSVPAAPPREGHGRSG